MGSDVGKNLQVKEEVLRRKEGDNGELIVKESKGENNKRESVNTERKFRKRKKE